MLDFVIPELDEEVLTQFIEVTCNLIYCIAMISGYFFLPNEVMLIIGIITFWIGPLIVFAFMSIIFFALYILSIYPTYSGNNT